ncbi:MAG TPA: DUF6183 family protein [Acidimicrobiia bacterium]
MSRSLDETTLAAIEYADTDALVRIVDAMCSRRAWDEIVALRIHCRAAVERGKQVWSIEENARYRLALEGPDDLAGEVVAEGPARFTLGPLPEVAAQSHRWSTLEPFLGSGPERAIAAHERALRGEDIDPSQVDPHVLEIPIRLQPWEPDYPLAEYASDRAEFPAPAEVPYEWRDLAAADRIGDDEVEDALLGLVTPWVTSSNGVAETAAVNGDAFAAVGSFGLRRAGFARVSPAAAMAWMGWAAASGGAYGRRRGAASGRFHAWWAAAALAGLDVPPSPDELGEAMDELRWYLWTDGVTPGWTLRLAVEDPSHDLAWAITAVDERADEPSEAQATGAPQPDERQPDDR